MRSDLCRAWWAAQLPQLHLPTQLEAIDHFPVSQHRITARFHSTCSLALIATYERSISRRQLHCILELVDRPNRETVMHALAFRVMRLCRPNLPSDGLLRADLTADFVPDELAISSDHENVVGLPVLVPPPSLTL